MKISYVCVDLETTGLNTKADKIMEIGAVKVIEGERMDCFSTLVYPGRTISEEVTRLTGIQNSDVRDASGIREVIPKLLDFLGELPLLGHSLMFDYAFLKKAAVNEGFVFEREGIDTLKIARKHLPELESRSLGSLCSYYHIPHKPHRALQDAEATSVLFQKLAEAFEKGAPEDFRPRPLQYKVKKEVSATKNDKERLYTLIQRHNLIVDYDVEMLTRNEASRFADRILAEYGR